MPYLELEEPEGEIEPGEVDLPIPGGMTLRDYQKRAILAVEDGWATYKRQLVVMATGTGKTVTFSKIAQDEVRRGRKVVIVCHTEELIAQAADKLLRCTGIVAGIEKADEYASASDSVVVASIQTLSRENRLLGFPQDHFGLVIIDECHRSLSVTHLRVINYFHFGERSLDPDWVAPLPGEPCERFARILGFTATADRGDRRNLGQIYDHCPRECEFGLLEACREGYLVRPVAKLLPLKIDVEGVKMRGRDLDSQEVAERLTPLLNEIARQIRIEAWDRKTIVWLPSIDSARRLSEALAATGLKANFVSGECPDRAEKIEAFRQAGPGSVMCNAMLLTEGVDIVDVDCGCMLRVTTIRSLLAQAMGRGMRVLPGVIDGLETAAERLAAIAKSAKRMMLILDFTWVSTRLDLVKPVDLVIQRPDLRKQAEETAERTGITDLLDLEATASRDLLVSLQEAAKKHARKAARTLDPLAWAVELGDARLAAYEPETELERRPPTEGMLNFLRRQRIDVSQVTCFGLAREMIARITNRFRMDLATPHQLHFLAQLGFDREKAVVLSQRDATATIDALLSEKKNRHAQRK
jgi:superfamily II DNA or RNA helicase